MTTPDTAPTGDQDRITDSAATEHVVTITPRTVYDVRCSCSDYGWDGVGKEMAETLAEGHRKWAEKRHA